MLNSTRTKTLTLCTTGVLAALYVPLALFLAVQIGNVRISFGSLPVVVAALLLGPLESVAVAFVGEFLKQILSYGFTATTLLYLIPPALRGLIIGWPAFLLLQRRSQRLEERRILCYAVCIAAAVFTTIGNTLVNLLDSILYHYYTPVLIFGDLLYRLGVGILNAVVITTAAIPLVILLRHQLRHMLK